MIPREGWFEPGRTPEFALGIEIVQISTSPQKSIDSALFLRLVGRRRRV